ncbi:DUF2971 domain-containing protein [Pseudomonas sp. zjy_15]|uniref:DUF2971 domain-containing protein n=1 Tax=Pseudomonas sp. zjy_15 TaxID=3367265 RepID=UPI00370C90AD
MDVEETATYYKYRSCSQRTWEILCNRELYFSLPKDLNDPLDVSVDVTAEYERAKNHIYKTDKHPEGRKSFLITVLDSIRKVTRDTGEELSLSQALYRFMQGRGILSLSKTSRDALLWSHYADGHRGICLGFNAEILKIDGASGSGDIQYLPSPPYMEKFLELTEEFGEFCRPWDGVNFSDEQGTSFYNRQVDAILQIGLYTKSESWKYEKEFRITSEPGNHAFSPSALVEVILGAKTSEADEKKIKDFLSADHYSHVRLKRAFNIPGTFSFGSRLLV